MELSGRDTQVLRQLAARCMEIAALPAQKETKELWLSLNRCQMQRPMVVLDQIPWHEMDVDGLLQCQVDDPYWRGVETSLRQTLYRWKYMPADMAVNPYVLLPRPLRFTGCGPAVNEETVATDAGNPVVGHRYINQFQTEEDLEKLKQPAMVLDAGAEKRLRQQAEALFRGVAPFVFAGAALHLGVWDSITMWMGVEDIYMDLVERPEYLHAIMERLTGGLEVMIEQMNRDGLFDIYSNQCHCSYTFSDDLPALGCDPERPRSKDAWAMGLAQLFTSVSPRVTAEFEVPYMKRLFSHFGAIYYGCCDRLDDRLDIVAQMPNIRKISCSPWSEREVFAEKLPRGVVMSSKPNPSLLVGAGFDKDAVRADLRRTVNAAKACRVPLELILKDISTLEYQPQRLWQWAEIAMEEVRR